MTALRIRPVWQKEARAFVRAHHSHHNRKMQAAEIFRLGAYHDGALVAVALMNCTTAPGLCSSEVWEIGRVCCGPDAPKFTASRLYGACGRVMDGAGVQLGITYTRIDERGSSLLAANWTPVMILDGRAHDTGNRAHRWLPGFYEPSTEIMDRVRWERGPLAPTKRPAVEWDESVRRWVSRGSTRGSGAAPTTPAPESVTISTAGDRDRTGDIQLGKPTADVGTHKNAAVSGGDEARGEDDR